MVQPIFHCCHNFLTVTDCYHNKVTPIIEGHPPVAWPLAQGLAQEYGFRTTPIGIFNAKKIAEVVLLYVFTIGLPASLSQIHPNSTKLSQKVKFRWDSSNITITDDSHCTFCSLKEHKRCYNRINYSMTAQ